MLSLRPHYCAGGLTRLDRQRKISKMLGAKSGAKTIFVTPGKWCLPNEIIDPP
jgi:hypothetical protein